MYISQRCGFKQTEAQGNRCDVCNSNELQLVQESLSENATSNTTGQAAIGFVAIAIGVVLLIGFVIMNAVNGFFDFLIRAHI